ncbi:MAG: DUF1592 domain-containing protein [Fuerstiella sp.]
MIPPKHFPTHFAVACILTITASQAVQSGQADSAPPLVSIHFSNTNAGQQPHVFHSDADSRLKLIFRADDATKVRRTPEGLQLLPGGCLKATEGSKPLMRALKQANQLTLETWIRPENLAATGPARIVTLSQDSSNRNLTLGQEGHTFEVRLRTTKTGNNGLPPLVSAKDSVKKRLTHVAFTRSTSGQTKTFVNGKMAGKASAAGTLSNWDPSFQFAVGDEISGGRSWQGQVLSIVIHDRSLTAGEIQNRFQAGPTEHPTEQQLADRKQRAAARHFETKIAPLLSDHCLECHDSANRKGGLDLSKKTAAFARADSGDAIVRGKSEDSSLWQSIQHDDMPHNRPALSKSDKSLVKQWIDDGATWSLDAIDPAIYQHSGGDQRWVQRLTVDEYIQTVRSITGVDIEAEAIKRLPADLRADGFSNTSYNLNVDLKHIDAWAKLAEIIVANMEVRPFVEQFSRKRKFTDKDMADVISKMGEWVLRGPISNDEIVAYRGITTSVAAAGGSFDEAMALLLEAMLQSPRFLYRIERQPSENSAIDVNSYELASRLSYILWGGPPDHTLLKAAKSGQLDVAEQAQRMLDSPLARQQSQRFIEDWLNLKRLKNLQPNQDRFPSWSVTLAEDMRLETLRFADYVLWEEGLPLANLLNTQRTFTTADLAKFYQLPTVKPVAEINDHAADVLIQQDLTDVKGRGGLLTHGSVLTIGGDDASMVTRGLLVMHELLRGVVKDPPPCVDTTPVPTEPGITQRSIALQRINNSSCGGCHSKFEPLAFGLEKFDGIGRYHESDEHGNRLRDDGEILFPGAPASIAFSSSEELMNLLAKSDRVKESFTWKVTQFALGRPLAADDAATVSQIHQQAQDKGGTWQATITAIVNSDLVTKSKR